MALRGEPLNYHAGMQERLLAEQLIGYDTSNPEGIRNCAGFVKGWLEARDIPTKHLLVRELPIIVAEVGPSEGPVVVVHGHIDVVPGQPGQFEPITDGDRLIGRGAYDMKGAAAAMMLALADLRDQDDVRVRLAFVPDEETEEEARRHVLLRLGTIVVGFVVLIGGLVMMALPGPGIVTVIAGLAILSRELPWAERMLEYAKEKARVDELKEQPAWVKGVAWGFTALAIGASLWWMFLADPKPGLADILPWVG